MKTAQDILKEKNRDIISVRADQSVSDAIQVMGDNNIGAILVEEGDRYVGIFSERDYARKVILKGKSSKETAVGDLMTLEVYYINPDATMEDCMALMTAKQIRHLPVMEDDKLIGVVTLGDVVNQVISDQKVTIQELEKYITGGYGA